MSKIFRQKQKHSYVTIEKTCLNDTRLSLKAKGLHTYVMGLPDDWDVYVKDLINRHEDGRDSILSALKQLEKFGYLRREMKRGKNGQSQGCDYFFFEIPQEGGSPTGGVAKKDFERQPENPFAVNPLTVNRPLINNEYKQVMNNSKQEASDYQEDIAPAKQKSIDVAAADFFDDENDVVTNTAHCQADVSGTETLSEPESNELIADEQLGVVKGRDRSVVRTDPVKPMIGDKLTDCQREALERLAESINAIKPDLRVTVQDLEREIVDRGSFTKCGRDFVKKGNTIKKMALSGKWQPGKAVRPKGRYCPDAIAANHSHTLSSSESHNPAVMAQRYRDSRQGKIDEIKRSLASIEMMATGPIAKFHTREFFLAQNQQIAKYKSMLAKLEAGDPDVAVFPAASRPYPEQQRALGGGK